MGKEGGARLMTDKVMRMVLLGLCTTIEKKRDTAVLDTKSHGGNERAEGRRIAYNDVLDMLRELMS
jgi:hypothetical protein